MGQGTAQWISILENSELLLNNRMISEEILKNNFFFLLVGVRVKEMVSYHYKQNNKAKRIFYGAEIIYEEFICSLTKLQKSAESATLTSPESYNLYWTRGIS